MSVSVGYITMLIASGNTGVHSEEEPWIPNPGPESRFYARIWVQQGSTDCFCEGVCCQSCIPLSFISCLIFIVI